MSQITIVNRGLTELVSRMSLLFLIFLLNLISSEVRGEPVFFESEFWGDINSLNLEADQQERLEAVLGRDTHEKVAKYSQRTFLRKFSEPVGRLDVKLTDGQSISCTAFLISDDIALTNYHCIPGYLHRTSKHGRVMAARLVMNYLDFNSEYKTFDVDPLPVGGSAKEDYALIRVQGRPGREFGFVSFSTEEPEPGDLLWIAHHPGRSVKYVTRGDCRVADPSASDGAQLFHRCDTLPGSSGAPIFNQLNEVVAVHRAGASFDSFDQTNFGVLSKFIDVNLRSIINTDGETMDVSLEAIGWAPLDQTTDEEVSFEISSERLEFVNLPSSGRYYTTTFSRDGKFLAVGAESDDASVHLLDLQAGKIGDNILGYLGEQETAFNVLGYVGDLEFSYDSEILFAAVATWIVAIHTDTGTELNRFVKGHTTAVTGLELTKDARFEGDFGLGWPEGRFVSADYNGKVSVWNFDSRVPERSFYVDGRIHDLKIARSIDRVFLNHGNFGVGHIKLDSDDGDAGPDVSWWPFPLGVHERGVRDLSVDSQGRFMAFRYWDRDEVHIWSLKKFGEKAKIREISDALDYAISDDGSSIILRTRSGIELQDLESGRVIASIDADIDVYNIALSESGRCVSFGGLEGVWIWKIPIEEDVDPDGASKC